MAKDANIRANQSAEELIKQLHLGGEPQPPSPPPRNPPPTPKFIITSPRPPPPNPPSDNSPQKTHCGGEKFTVSDKGNTKFQGCQVGDIGTAVFINDRVKTVAGVREGDITRGKQLLNCPKREILGEYPLDV